MNKEVWNSVSGIDTECSVNDILYNATDLTIMLRRLDNDRQVRVVFKNIIAYRVTLEQFRWVDVGTGGKTTPLYEIRDSLYIQWIRKCGLEQLYGYGLKLRHFAIKTTEHIIDIITTESCSISN